MEIKKFSELSTEELEKIINKHFEYWSRYSSMMTLEDTMYKFKNVLTSDELPYGIALMDNDNIIGFCTLKLNDLKKYPQFNPWICSVMIFDEYRGKGFGTKLIEFAKMEYKKLGYNEVYLWTDKAPIFYEKIGFNYVQDILKNDESGYGRLYQIDL